MKNLPVATYRLQLNKDFTLTDACAVADYLRELNISHLYLSPIFASSPDSNHGYDVTDFSRISEERGGAVGFKDLTDKICAYDYPMKMILDIVPNHMAANTNNPYWLDVLKNGRNSEYWSLFDLRVENSQQIKLAVLSSDINSAELELTEDGIKFENSIFPLNEKSLAELEKNPSIDVISILDLQHYSLVPWQDISDSMSYRRFFDVTGLIGIKVENKDTYLTSHKALFDLLDEYPCIDGIRVDHIDGLADPKTYLERLYQSVPDIWIEKILARPETISNEWKTKGTTGYEFIDRINQLFVHSGNFNKIQDHWLEKTRSKWKDFQSCVFESKQQVLKELFTPELKRLVELSTNDINLHDKAWTFWAGLTVSLDVYRVYKEQNLEDSKWLHEALELARKNFGQNYIEAEKIFLPQLLSPVTDGQKQAFQEWQQLSGPVMAKGLEDTAHYRFTPLTALNEVGCVPVLEQPTKADYFEWLQKRSHELPDTINATSTHDTKRSEDTRHRLYSLADRPETWIEFTAEADLLDDSTLPASAKYFIYQNILGTWPLDGYADDDYKKRIKDYLKKANREAKLSTSWMSPSEDYETSIDAYIDDILSNKDFVKLVKEFSALLSLSGAINSLSILTLKILSPGIPDIYQGMEKWEFNLVDPDNRRPVDYALRQELLFVADNMQDEAGRKDLLDYMSRNWKDGTVKVWLTRELLRIREKYLVILEDFKIAELQTNGKYADNLIAYSLSSQTSTNGLIILCPRYPGLIDKISNLSLNWEDTGVELPKDHLSELHDLINDRPLSQDNFKSVSSIFTSFPIAVISFK